MLGLYTVSVVDGVLNLEAFNKQVRLALLSCVVLQLGHLDLIFDFCHSRLALSRLADSFGITLHLGFVPVLGRPQDSAFLVLQHYVEWLRLNALHKHLSRNASCFEELLREPGETFFLLLLRPQNGLLVPLPVLIREVGSSLPPFVPHGRHSCPRAVVDDETLEV